MSSNFESTTYNRAAVHGSSAEPRRADGDFAPTSTMTHPNPAYETSAYQAERPTEALGAATHHTGGFQPQGMFPPHHDPLLFPTDRLSSGNNPGVGTDFSTGEVKRNPYPAQTLEERGERPWNQTENEFRDSTTTTDIHHDTTHHDTAHHDTTHHDTTHHDTTHPKPKLADKIVGGAQVAIGKATKNEGLLEKGLERKTGEHRTRETEDNY